ncbi:hypothetical protein ACQP25_13410 [Microtetraspora malaysiensis]|uniref:hypothetical protein n=1 Tax=Microtetraspora malaysiensis TaxID=161358 RepID=UPI003D9359FB
MYAGLALTVIAAVAPFIDVATVDSITDHVRGAYPDWPADLVAGDRNAIIVYLSVVTLLGVVGWLWTIWAVAKRKRWSRVATTVMFVLGACHALSCLAFSGGQYANVVPYPYGALASLPVLAGLGVVIALWLRGPTTGATRR